LHKKAPRASVSAEAFGIWNKKSDFKPRVVAKSDSVKQRIQTRLSHSFMFQALNEKEMAIVVDAMEEKKYKEGDIVI
jgi:cAMP-dependent protein kinase regulator